jgi:cytochrome c2
MRRSVDPAPRTPRSAERDGRDSKAVHRGRAWRISALVGVLGSLLCAVVASVAITLPSAADEHDSPPSQPLVEGKQLFESKGCGHCHGVMGAKTEERVGLDLGRGRSWRDAMELAGALWNHTPAMLAEMRAQGVERAVLTPDDLGKLSAYFLYSRFLDEPADVERGREIFDARSCARCHQLGGRGGTVGPRLDELAPQVSSLFMAQALWNHGPEMAAKMAELGLERPRLEGDEVAEIVAFIRGPDRAAPSLQEMAAQLGSPRAGKAVFSMKGCVKCHAIAGSGGTIGPDLAARAPMGSVGEMAGALWNHGPAMWRKMQATGVTFPKLSGPETADLLAYLYFVQYMDERGDAARGAELFRAKSCASCHAANQVGVRVGPDLATSNAMRSPLDWASAMWSHAPAMAEKFRDRGMPWPRFADDEMRDLVSFLRSHRETR